MPAKTMTSADDGTAKRSPRDRLLQAASELFYAGGVGSGGSDRVIERAGVAKASCYSTFGSKEGLVCAYLNARHEETLARLRSAVAATEDPIERLLAVFDAQARLFRTPDFHGCAFTAAAPQAPAGGRVDRSTQSHPHDIPLPFHNLTLAAALPDHGPL